MSSGVQPEAWEVLPWDNPEANPLEDLNNIAKRLFDHDFLSEDLDTEKEGNMKYENLQKAHTLVDGYSQAEQDVLKPFLPELPKQKTLDEIIQDVYEAYMCETEQYNLDRLAEIHFQLTNWGKIPPAREKALYYEDYEELPEDSVVLGQGCPWVKREGLWHNTFGGPVGDDALTGEPREVVRKGNGYVQ